MGQWFSCSLVLAVSASPVPGTDTWVLSVLTSNGCLGNPVLILRVPSPLRVSPVSLQELEWSKFCRQNTSKGGNKFYANLCKGREECGCVEDLREIKGGSRRTAGCSPAFLGLFLSTLRQNSRDPINNKAILQ